MCFPWGERLCFYSQLCPLLWVQHLPHNKYLIFIQSKRKEWLSFDFLAPTICCPSKVGNGPHPVHRCQLVAASQCCSGREAQWTRAWPFCDLSSLKHRMDFQAWGNHANKCGSSGTKAPWQRENQTGVKAQLALEETKELPSPPGFCFVPVDKQQTPRHFQDSLLVRYFVVTRGRICPGIKKKNT